MTAPRELTPDEPPPAAARLLEALALAGILAVLAVRGFLAELPFRTAQFVPARGALYRAPEELIRVALAMVLLGSAAVWALGQCLRRRAKMTAPAFGIIVVAFAGWSLAPVFSAIDKRGALTGWLELTSILLAAFVMIQLARRVDRWWLVVAVLAAVGGAVAARGIVQRAVEIPDRIALFEEDPAGTLADQGIVAGTPAARMFAKRLRDTAPTGFFGLANVFASLLIVTGAAAGGIVLAKFAAWRRRQSLTRGPGEIPLPVLAAAIGLIPAALAAAVLVMTRSKGGIAAGVLAAVLAGAVLAGRGLAGRWRRGLLIVAAIVVIGGIAAAAGYGVKRGGLPSRSLQVRWEYWQGSAGVIAEKPFFGTGADNFGHAYLRYRPAAAAESTKYPHNVLLGATAQFGVLGGALLVGMIAWMLVTATRPALPRPEPTSSAKSATSVAWCIFLTAAVAVGRGLWDNPSQPAVWLIAAGVPAAVFGVLLIVALWSGNALGPPAGGERCLRVALAAGLAGFVAHNLVTFTFFTPATATAFWLAGGALAGRADLKTRCLSRGATGVLAIILVAGAIAAGVLLCRPVYRRSQFVQAAQESYSLTRDSDAADYLRQAVDADCLDGFAPAGLSGLHQANWLSGQFPPAEMDRAIELAQLAWQRRPSSGNALRLANVLKHRSDQRERAAELASRAVALDPMNTRTRIDCAWRMLAAGQIAGAAEQLARVREIDAALPPDSDLRLTESELAGVALLEGSLTSPPRQ